MKKLLLILLAFLLIAPVFAELNEFSDKGLIDIDRYNRLVVERQGEELIYQAILDTDIEYSSTALDEIMKSHKFIRSIERYDDN